MDIYTFDKCLQERQMEYKNILSSPGKTVPASQIRSEWVCDLDVVIEPVGWQALWNMSRSACEDFSIHYPTVVLVEILSIESSSLKASVKIVAVQDDIHLPEKHKVDLLELYPTIKQTNTSLDIVGTAHCVDRLRFFYNHLWMPWDQDDDENIDWVEQHLDSRIRLAYDMKRGIIDKDTCDHIKSLVKEGKEIEKKIAILDDKIPDEIEEVQDKIRDEACQLMKLHFRLQQIKSEMDMLENPMIREIIMKNQSMINEKKSKVDRKDKKNIAHFVWRQGTIKELRQACDKMQGMEPEDLTVKVYKHLTDALRVSEAGDIILMGEGIYEIKHISGLEEGGIIRGIYNRDYTVICPKELGSGALALLDFSGMVLLDNICIDLGELEVGLIARKGTIKVNGCRIRDLSQSNIKLGMVVMPGAKLIIEHSTFQGLGAAVVVYGTGELIMTDCRFENCVDGIQLCDNAHFTATECHFENLKQYGIRMETEKYIANTGSRSGCSELLDDVSEVKLVNCKFFGNAEADVALKPKGFLALAEQQEMVS